MVSTHLLSFLIDVMNSCFFLFRDRFLNFRSQYELNDASTLSALKVQTDNLKKHWQIIAYVVQRYHENFIFKLFKDLK